jgi:hypothetical protein
VSEEKGSEKPKEEAIDPKAKFRVAELQRCFAVSQEARKNSTWKRQPLYFTLPFFLFP